MQNRDKYKNAKVLILGLGLNDGGVGSARFFAKNGARVKVTDLKSREVLKDSLAKLVEFSDIEYILGEHRFEDIDWADIVIRNPALRPDNEYRLYAKKAGKKVETDLGIFLDFVSADQIIGVTGTKGKSTTASLIYFAVKDLGSSKPPSPLREPEGFGHELSRIGSSEPRTAQPSPSMERESNEEERGAKAILVGNIGKSVLDCLEMITPETKVVLELSSFQLEAFDEHRVSPHIAVITNILPDHLNYYSSMDEYTEAKKAIGRYQTEKDFLFILKDDSMVDTEDFLKDVKSQVIRFSIEDLPKEFEPTLPGDHNLQNYAAALAVTEKFSASQGHALQAMNQFQGAEFRLQLLGKFRGVRIYNDSASTMPDSTVRALETLKSPILIVGGMDKGLPYDKLAHEIDRKVKSVYFIDGTATEKLRPMLQHRNIIRSIYTDFDSLLKDLKLELKEGDTILFSPAATSFNFFQNEFDRGRKFNIAIEKMFKN